MPGEPAERPGQIRRPGQKSMRPFQDFRMFARDTVRGEGLFASHKLNNLRKRKPARRETTRGSNMEPQSVRKDRSPDDPYSIQQHSSHSHNHSCMCLPLCASSSLLSPVPPSPGRSPFPQLPSLLSATLPPRATYHRASGGAACRSALIASVAPFPRGIVKSARGKVHFEGSG